MSRRIKPIRTLNPFELEKVRSTFAKNKSYDRLIKTYQKQFPEIPNWNTSELWDRLNIKFSNKLKDNPMARDRLNTVSNLLDKIKGRILNVGFGSADLEEIFFRKSRVGVSWYGIDISPLSVDLASKRFPNLKFDLGNLNNLKSANNFFDCIIILEVLEHIPPNEIFACLKRVYKVLKRKGKLIISIPLNENLQKMFKTGLNPNAHVRVYTPDLIEAELHISGFRILWKKNLYAFHSNYYIKSLLVNLIFKTYRHPNNFIIVAGKK